MSKKITVIIVDDETDETYITRTFIVPEEYHPEKFAIRIEELLMDNYEEEDLEEDDTE